MLVLRYNVPQLKPMQLIRDDKICLTLVIAILNILVRDWLFSNTLGSDFSVARHECGVHKTPVLTNDINDSTFFLQTRRQ